MKKLLYLLTMTTLITTSSLSLASCGKNKINIVMTPGSITPKTFKKIKKSLEHGLYWKMRELDEKFNFKFNIFIGTDAVPAVESLKSGTSALAFISTNKYETTIDDITEESSIAPLVIAMKNPMKADLEVLIDNLKPERLLNLKESFKIAKEHDSYLKKISKNEELDLNSVNKAVEKENKENNNKLVKYYRSYVYVNNEVLNEYEYDLEKINNENDYKEKTKKFILNFAKDVDNKEKNKDKEKDIYIAYSAASSFHFPLLWMKRQLNISDDELEKIAKKRVSPKPIELRSALTTKKIMCFGLSDMRALDNNKNEIKEALKNSSIIGVTDAILTEGLFYSKKWMNLHENGSIIVNNLRKAFKDLVKEKKYKDTFNALKIFDYDAPDLDNLDYEQSSKSWEDNYKKLSINEKKIINEMNKIRTT